MARGLKLRIKEEEGLFYPCSKSKGADQLRGYREADLRLGFRICKNPVFSQRGSYAKKCFSSQCSSCMSMTYVLVPPEVQATTIQETKSDKEEKER